MWMLLAYFVVATVVIASLMPKPDIEDARAAQLGDFSFPRAGEGDPVPLIWGTVRLRSPNTIWYGDYTAVPIKKKVDTGLFTSKKVTVGYKYYLGLDLALCLGFGVKLTKIWAGKYVAWTGSIIADGDLTINQPNLFGGDEKSGGLAGTASFFTGSFSQARDAYLATKCDPNVPAYGGFCHIVFKSFYVGTQPSLQAFNFELARLTDSLGSGKGTMPNGLDANPMEILYDAITGSWGRLGISTGLIDTASWQACAATLYNENHGMSLSVQRPNSGKTIAEEVLRQIDGLLYQDPETGKIKAKLVRQDYILASLPTLDVTTVTEVRGFSKTTWDNTYNQARVSFTNRSKDYVEGIAVAQDFGNINFQQRVRSTEVSMPGVMDGALAGSLASRILSNYSVPLYKAELHCTRAASFLRPGDPFVLSWAPFRVTSMVMRVQRIDLGRLTDGTVVIECIQDQFAVNQMVFATPEASSWVPVSLVPGPIVTYKIMPAPRFLPQAAGLGSGQGIWVGARKPSSASVSFSADWTQDGYVNTYRGLEQQTYLGTARLALAYDITAGGVSRYDTVTGIRIELLDDTSVLQNVAGTNGEALLVLNDEILSYTGYTNNGDGTYTLNNVRRNLLDTTVQTHTIGSYLYFVQGQECLFDQVLPGTSATIRLMNETPTGAEEPGAGTLVSFDQRDARPAPSTYLTLNGSRTPAAAGPGATSVAVAWRERNRLDTAIRWYDDATQTPEVGQVNKVEYQLNGGGWTTASSSVVGTSYSLNVTGFVGTLDVRVSSQTSLASRVVDQLSITLL
jgi:hypothetical protein